MKKVGIVVIVSVLAVAGVIAALAYSAATVENDFILKVVSTDKALLALKPGLRNHKAAYLDEGELKFNLNIGKNDELFGLNRRSEYVWDGLFMVKNNSERNIQVRLRLDEQNNSHAQSTVELSAAPPQDDPQAIQPEVYVRKPGTKTWLKLSSNNAVDVYYLSSATNAWASIDIKVTTGKAPLDDYNWTLVVEAEAQ
ncbi:MAG: hypothetical protein WBK48_01070 [Dethiobacteria bacterium]|jgi:hypothetical protein|nr:hypothetical protein [Bacillota bacterium]HOP69736.1 hypothetical protein [Bacillota bacterium]HPT33612.1 hypothetical protein [Bacillota bacterium]HPZ64413.1 hypothetical protein [Bacillota bacterium]